MRIAVMEAGAVGGYFGARLAAAGLRLARRRADHRPIAVEYAGYPVITLHRSRGFVEETVTALGYSTELAGHLFRECWAVGTGSEELSRAFGWNDREVEAHRFKVATAAGLVAIWHNARITVDRGQEQEEVSGAGHARSVAAS